VPEITTEPRLAGFEDEFMVESWFRTAPGPKPLPSRVKMAGVDATTDREKPAINWPPLVIDICVVFCPETP
jgi:hypothetical protein